MITEYQSQYYAYQLTKRHSSDDSEKLSQSLLNATVDLNPHQIEAALFAFRSPLSRGAILADEVGLGKTIEAGLILSQLWAERKRRILCILPANLRKQWNRELIEKFFIDSTILESKNFRAIKKEHGCNPFEQKDRVVICSYQFARSRVEEMQLVPWDLVVIDEAHRVRNVYKKSNKIARAIRDAVQSRPKVLLTATPLQNSLMELFGLVSFVDPLLFGSEETFRSQFASKAANVTAVQFEELRHRIRPVCQRTLRRQVTEYVPYTNRMSITQDFTPTDNEVRLYEVVSAYLQKPELVALPSGQRKLITLMLRKILASSSFAIAATLGKLITRLERILAEMPNASSSISDVLGEDVEHADEVEDEWPDEEDSDYEETNSHIDLKENVTAEISELRDYKKLAESIQENAKGNALLTALKQGMSKADELKAPRKALIFTESRRTQAYLKELLEQNGYAGQLVTFNGTNTDADSKRIYGEWMQQHAGEDSITGSPTADMRSALVDYFRNTATIMIATESAAEGVNLQFCNLVVNYDLPWNPQRIEQRIGRCHRYGQKFDVVVINFVNRKNEADQRVFQLLSEKFRLFDGVFGASDEVLGTLESGVDFEKRIADIYQKCRTNDEIRNAFDALQSELEEQIRVRMDDARTKLLEHFDQDVHERLRIRSEQTQLQVDRVQQWLWQVTKFELDDVADFDDQQFAFRLRSRPPWAREDTIPVGQYKLITQPSDSSEHHFRFGHPLVTAILDRAKGKSLPTASVKFDYTSHVQNKPKVALVEQLKGLAGWLRVTLLEITALDTEERLVLTAVTDEGKALHADAIEKFLTMPARIESAAQVPPSTDQQLTDEYKVGEGALLEDVRNRNLGFFEQEVEKLDRWAEDLKQNLERELKELAAEIRALKRDSRLVQTLEEKIDAQKRIRELESRQKDKRRRLFEAEDQIDQERDSMIGKAQDKLTQQVNSKEIFTIRWSVV